MKPYETFQKQVKAILDSKDDDKTKLLKIQVASDFVDTMAKDISTASETRYAPQMNNYPSQPTNAVRQPQTQLRMRTSTPMGPVQRDPLQDMDIVNPKALPNTGKKASRGTNGGIITTG